MDKYISTDALYEDIYDFDDLLEKPPSPVRPGGTYTVNGDGERRRPLYRPRVDDAPRLPPVIVTKVPDTCGPTGLPPIQPSRNSRLVMQSMDLKADDRRVRPSSRLQQNLLRGQSQTPVRDARVRIAKNVNQEKDPWSGSQKHQPNPSVSRDSNWDTDYKYLMDTDRFDPSNNPLVRKYEERQRLFGDIASATSAVHQKPNGDVISGLFENMVLSTSTAHETALDSKPPLAPRPPSVPKPEGIHQRVRANIHAARLVPRPPSAQKPEDHHVRANIGHRHVRNRTTDVDQNISVHRETALVRRPFTPLPKHVADIDDEVREAIRVQEELDELHRRIADEKRRKLDAYLGDMDLMRPTTAAAANCNLPGRTTPCPIPSAALPTKTREHVKQWDGHTAKRGVGFRSKLKKEATAPPARSNMSTVPEKIRLQMKKYFT
ncbi:hypothetical protein MAR_018459 [Mya arenaria]|uniref:Uncharacterized protein n=1 Tax=Mya arenaria TaxID=6604 RepID=A0ABY7EMT8_MYAAR|nr:hypothetical protein MAR_018459 [Mya arenaria]